MKCLILLVTAAVAVSAQPSPGATRGGSIDPPAGSKILFKAHAKGVQMYQCKVLPNDPTWFAWDAAHAEPDAVLMNKKGEIIIHHYLNLDPAGPAWEAKDGSKIVGKKVDPAQPHDGTIPWLLLQAVSHEGDPGMLTAVTHIQRVDTEGGIAPSGQCDPNKTPRIRVPYQATYQFFGSK